MNCRIKAVLAALASIPDYEVRRRLRNDPCYGVWKAEVARRGISETEPVFYSESDDDGPFGKEAKL